MPSGTDNATYRKTTHTKAKDQHTNTRGCDKLTYHWDWPGLLAALAARAAVLNPSISNAKNTPGLKGYRTDFQTVTGFVT